MKRKKSSEVNYWMSYADLMSSMLMVFVMLLMMVVLDYKEVLSEKENEIKEVVSVKTEIIQALSEAFNKSSMAIDIDEQTGAIRLPGNILFESNSTDISPEGETFLNQFVPVYLSILMKEEFKDEISSIIIEGHTDQNGTYMYNMGLSQNRAYSVLKYIYSAESVAFPEKPLSQSYITANGRSFSNLLKNEQGEIDQNRSRRVEFLFRLKDDEAIQAIDKLVNE